VSTTAINYTQQPGVYPHLLRFWGGDADAVCKAMLLERNERGEEDDPGAVAVWFDTEQSRQLFIDQAKPRFQWLMFDVHRSDPDPEEHSDPHRLTRARVTLEYKGQRYTFVSTFGYGYRWRSVEFMWREGNYACDCNRSLFLQRQCGVVLADDESLGDRGDERVLPCHGDKVTLVALEDASER
jgi:hypothetical protein